MRKYDEEFKREAVKKILDGQSVAGVSRETGVSENQLHISKRQKREMATESERKLMKKPFMADACCKICNQTKKGALGRPVMPVRYTTFAS
jgi:transposase-like protein